MHTRAITYENLDGEQVTETHSFNLTKAEAVELNFTQKGGIEAYARKIIETEEHGQLVELFKDLILKTYGIREGQRFVKADVYTDAFIQTGAYSALFIELATNAESAIAFFREIFPKDMQGRVDEAVAPSAEPTEQELLTMSWTDFYKFAGGPDDKNWDKKYLLLGFRRKGNPSLAA